MNGLINPTPLVYDRVHTHKDAVRSSLVSESATCQYSLPAPGLVTYHKWHTNVGEPLNYVPASCPEQWAVIAVREQAST